MKTSIPAPQESDAARYHRLRFEHDHADALKVIGEAITIKPERVLRVARALRQADELASPYWERRAYQEELEELRATAEDHDSNCRAPDDISSLEQDVEKYEAALDQIKDLLAPLDLLDPETKRTSELLEMARKINEIIAEARS